MAQHFDLIAIGSGPAGLLRGGIKGSIVVQRSSGRCQEAAVVTALLMMGLRGRKFLTQPVYPIQFVDRL
jgi:hypothetical protein